MAGLVLGKPLGVFITTFLLAKFTRATLDDDLAWRDVLGVALLAGIGFTVSLLIGELAFGYGTVTGADAKIGVLVGSRGGGGVGGRRPGQPQCRVSPHSRARDRRRGPRRRARRLRALTGLIHVPVRKLTRCFLRSAVPLICSTCRSRR